MGKSFAPLAVFEHQDRSFVYLDGQVRAIFRACMVHIGFLAGRHAAINLRKGPVLPHLVKDLYSDVSPSRVHNAHNATTDLGNLGFSDLALVNRFQKRFAEGAGRALP